MELTKNARSPCPTGIIAVAINGDDRAQHCGIVYSDAAGAIHLCDMQFEYQLEVRRLPAGYYWTRVKLDPDEVLQISVFIELAIERKNDRPPPYSFLYVPDSFDATGQIRDGIGLTCATFIVAIFDRLKLRVVNLSTWRERPKQDAEFRNRIIDYAVQKGLILTAARLMAERASFRLKPRELCGSASHSRYPVRFRQAAKLAKTVAKLVYKTNRG